MSDMAARDVVTIGAGENARDVIVYELTPVDYRSILMGTQWPADDAEPEEVARAQVSAMLFEDCSIASLGRFTRLPQAELEALPAGALRKLRDKARELNPDFFSALDRAAARQSTH
jgi:hypothetical protein